MRHRAERGHLNTQIAIIATVQLIGLLTKLGFLVSDPNTPSACRIPLFVVWFTIRPSAGGAQPGLLTSPACGLFGFCGTDSTLYKS
jgi:hypothetical protein